MDTTADGARHPENTASPHLHAGRPSLGTLFSILWRETTTLAREEAELAKVEMSEKASQAARGAGMIAAGGAVVFAGFLALMLAAINALMPLLPLDMATWLAPLIVGVPILLLGFIALAEGRRELKGGNLAPSRTWRSLRRDGRVIKEHVT
jgi:hypothetical protein